MTSGYAAIVLAGGAARRLGGADKPGLAVAGRSLLSRVLDAVADAYPRIVVGPPRQLPGDVILTREQPPGGGPVAALAAGLAALDTALQPGSNAGAPSSAPAGTPSD
ncbi:MAG: molybdenum cofactor guanylyltransferase, partial [Micromonosporaceae bacterium]